MTYDVQQLGCITRIEAVETVVSTTCFFSLSSFAVNDKRAWEVIKCQLKPHEFCILFFI